VDVPTRTRLTHLRHAAMPENDGLYTTCYNRFVRWRRAGGSEVILGAIVGWIIHWVVEVIVDAFVKRRHASETDSENGRP
jgi:hypothetical protein